jgi:uncharacterized damage-inducible protein DinB
MRKLTLLIVLVMMAAVAAAQGNKPQTPTNPNPLTSSSKLVYQIGTKFLLFSAGKVPEEYYSFKPTDAVRSFGQILGHVADSQYYFCSVARGEADPNPNIEKTKTSKADLIAALTDAFDYCDKTYDGITDTSGAQTVKFRGMDVPKLTVLNINNGHLSEHYGNLVTYMRLKNIVPPSSDPEVLKLLQRPPKK